MGYLPNPNNCIVWNKSKNRFEAYGMHSERGLMMFSYDPGLLGGKVDPHWVNALWLHLIDQTEQVTQDHIKRGALFEWVQANRNIDRQGATE